MEQGLLLRKSTTEMGKTAVLAGVGVYSFIEEQSKALLGQLIGKGEKYQNEELKVITDKVLSLKNNVTGRIHAREEVLETRIQSAFSGILNHLGVPTKSEITSLISHVEALTKKVEQLKKA
jgi:poly(hydroxyalkanoate) granule-associated protein